MMVLPGAEGRISSSFVSGLSTVLLQSFLFCAVCFYFYNFALMFYINVCLFVTMCISFLLFLFYVGNYFLESRFKSADM